ncbi:MAG: shikimate kinase [Planctomycetota bacterium]
MLIPRLERPFDLTLALPGSKSMAMRAMVLAGLAEGTTVLQGATPCDDVVRLAGGLTTLGFDLEWTDHSAGTLRIRGGLPTKTDAGGTIDCGLGGAPLRFLCALAALVPGDWILTGEPRLLERPLGPLLDALAALGVPLESRSGRAPVRIRGGRMTGGVVDLDATRSSQHLSALMLVGSRLQHGLEVTLRGELASRRYATMTRRECELFGATIEDRGESWRVAPSRLVSPRDLRVEGDWSAAGSFLTLAQLTGGRFIGTNLQQPSAQADAAVVDLLAALAGDGDLELDLGATPDQAPNLVSAALFRDGRTRFFGAPHLRDKESDRIGTLCAELRRLGAEVEETSDGFRVVGGRPLHGATLRCHHDHRLAMAFAMLGSRIDGVVLEGPDCVSKSYPHFFAELASAHESPRCIALVGMRGTGKSTLAPPLAAALRMRAFDLDLEFEGRHGPIRDFVERAGMPAFREHEAHLLTQILAPGRVVAIGGGAVETPANRALLRERAFVIQLDDDLATLEARLGDSSRPRLTDMPLRDEVREIAARRAGWYREVARLVIHGGDVAQRVGRIRRALATTTLCRTPRMA